MFEESEDLGTRAVRMMNRSSDYTQEGFIWDWLADGIDSPSDGSTNLQSGGGFRDQSETSPTGFIREFAFSGRDEITTPSNTGSGGGGGGSGGGGSGGGGGGGLPPSPPWFPPGWPPFILPPNTPLQCQNKGGTATLVGHSAFTSPSTPPGKWLRKDFTGTLTSNTYSNTNPCTNLLNSCNQTFSGACVYSAATGAIIENDGAITSVGSSCDLGSTSLPCGNGAPPVSHQVNYTTTQTLSRLDGTNVCESAGDDYAHHIRVGYMQALLTAPDTDQNAANRAAGSWSGWSTASSSSCLAWASVRTTGFSFSFQQAQWRVNLDSSYGLLPGVSYTINIDVWRRVTGVGSFALLETLTYTAVADGSGNLLASDDVPLAEGYETYVTMGSNGP